jgi:hypothetical protein
LKQSEIQIRASAAQLQTAAAQIAVAASQLNQMIFRSGIAMDVEWRKSLKAASLAVESGSSRDTRKWGRRLGSILKGGELIGLTGDLGSARPASSRFGSRLALSEDQIRVNIYDDSGASRTPAAVSYRLYRLDSVALDTWACANICFRGWRRSNGSTSARASELECITVSITFADAETANRIRGERRALCKFDREVKATL